MILNKVKTASFDMDTQSGVTPEKMSVCYCALYSDMTGVVLLLADFYQL